MSAAAVAAWVVVVAVADVVHGSNIDNHNLVLSLCFFLALPILL
jgi:hypothetical protein